MPRHLAKFFRYANISNCYERKACAVSPDDLANALLIWWGFYVSIYSFLYSFVWIDLPLLGSFLRHCFRFYYWPHVCCLICLVRKYICGGIAHDIVGGAVYSLDSFVPKCAQRCELTNEQPLYITRLHNTNAGNIHLGVKLAKRWVQKPNNGHMRMRSKFFLFFFSLLLNRSLFSRFCEYAFADRNNYLFIPSVYSSFNFCIELEKFGVNFAYTNERRRRQLWLLNFIVWQTRSFLRSINCANSSAIGIRRKSIARQKTIRIRSNLWHSVAFIGEPHDVCESR